MSCVFLVVPAVVASWPILCGAVAGAAAALGYKVLAADEEAAAQPVEQWVDISLEGSQVVAEAMQRGSEFTIRKDDVTATFRREADGRCVAHVRGSNRSEHELQAVGQELVGRVTQQYAYNKVLSELKSQGFTVTNEEVASDQTIRISVCKYV